MLEGNMKQFQTLFCKINVHEVLKMQYDYSVHELTAAVVTCRKP